MATQNPTGDGASITLSLAACDRPFLRRLFGAAADGINDELHRFAGQLRESEDELRAEESAYRLMLIGLDGTPIASHEAMRPAIDSVAAAVDRENQYARVVAEHDALHGLLAQVGESVSGSGESYSRVHLDRGER